MTRIFCDDDDAPIMGAPAFSPANLDGVVTSWFSLQHPLSVVTGSGYSSIHDILNPSNPITQSTDGARPPPDTSANGLPIITVATAQMPCAPIAARAGTASWGFWGWFKQATNADNAQSFHTGNGASVNRSHVFFRVSGTALRFVAFTSDTDSRIMDATGLTAAQWNFFTVEFNGARAGDARAIITVNGTPGSLSYGTSTGVAEMPATLRTVTGGGSIFAIDDNGPYFVGSIGTNFGFFGGAMAGATEGLLTAAARSSLMNFQRPT